MCTTTVPSRQSSSGLEHRDVEAMMQGLPSAIEGKQRGPPSIHIRCEPSRNPLSVPRASTRAGVSGHTGETNADRHEAAVSLLASHQKSIFMVSPRHSIT